MGYSLKRMIILGFFFVISLFIKLSFCQFIPTLPFYRSRLLISNVSSTHLKPVVDSISRTIMLRDLFTDEFQYENAKNILEYADSISKITKQHCNDSANSADASKYRECINKNLDMITDSIKKCNFNKLFFEPENPYTIWKEYRAKKESLKYLLIRKRDSLNQYIGSATYEKDSKELLDEFKRDKEVLLNIKNTKLKSYYITKEQTELVRWFPVRNTVSGPLYYNSDGEKIIEYLKNGYLKFNPKSGGCIYEEFLVGYLAIFRLSVGGLFSTSDLSETTSSDTSKSSAEGLSSILNQTTNADKVKNSIQRLLSGGGNLSIIQSTPIFDLHLYDNTIKLYVIQFDKFCLDIPQLNQVPIKTSYFNGFGFETGTSWLINGPSYFSLFATGRYTLLTGAVPFYKNLELNNYKPLNFFEWEGGVFIDHFKIFIGKSWINRSNLQKDVQYLVGINFIPFDNSN